MEVLAALAAQEQTVVKEELLTSPIPATGLLIILKVLTLEVGDREVNPARIPREARRGLAAIPEMKELILDASIKGEEL